MQCSRGFTLIELVVVIILVSILSVFALPRLLGASSYQTEVTRDALIADLRVMQQHRLAGQGCQLIAGSDAYRLDGDCEGGRSLSGLSLFLGSSESFTLTMDAMGRPTGDCDNGCALQLVGQSNLSICLESEGYVHGC
ncbi:type II secretion system protein [Ferrimonas marina]|uniref:MSHA pilin protein MshC n=1 Tax=Ferrimonas marina TaxID=299255 RepID=A0A1M5Y0M3_9GAMM|nr:type II secretion system protein [Ferrimonas marina]SHI05600.1 MSHA pilin protein MshC [Ferrimonas marina]